MDFNVRDNIECWENRCKDNGNRDNGNRDNAYKFTLNEQEYTVYVWSLYNRGEGLKGFEGDDNPFSHRFHSDVKKLLVKREMQTRFTNLLKSDKAYRIEALKGFYAVYCDAYKIKESVAYEIHYAEVEELAERYLIERRWF